MSALVYLAGSTLDLDRARLWHARLERSGITGRVFERLTAVSRAENTRDGKARWNCRRSCGKERVIRSAVLLSGRTRSCGCLRAEASSQRMLARLSARRRSQWLAQRPPAALEAA